MEDVVFITEGEVFDVTGYDTVEGMASINMSNILHCIIYYNIYDLHVIYNNTTSCTLYYILKHNKFYIILYNKA